MRQAARGLQAGHRPGWTPAGHPVAVQPAASQATHQVINAQLFELQHHAAQVGPQDLGVGLLLQVLLETGLSVQAKTLAGLRTPGTPRPLMSAGLQQKGSKLRTDCWGEATYSVAFDLLVGAGLQRRGNWGLTCRGQCRGLRAYK